MPRVRIGRLVQHFRTILATNLNIFLISIFQTRHVRCKPASASELKIASRFFSARIIKLEQACSSFARSLANTLKFEPRLKTELPLF